MMKNGLIGIAFILAGLVLVLGKFHFYVMLAGGAMIMISTIFINNFKHAMIRKIIERSTKKRLEK